MAFVAVDKNGHECIFPRKPEKYGNYWMGFGGIELPSGTIKKLIGRDLSWDDDPVELT